MNYVFCILVVKIFLDYFFNVFLLICYVFRDSLNIYSYVICNVLIYIEINIDLECV